MAAKEAIRAGYVSKFSEQVLGLPFPPTSITPQVQQLLVLLSKLLIFRVIQSRKSSVMVQQEAGNAAWHLSAEDFSKGYYLAKDELLIK